MSLNPHLGESSSSESWETISDNSSNFGSSSNLGSSSSIFFGGGEHTFSVFKEQLTQTLSRKTDFITFTGKSSSLPDLAHEVDSSFGEHEPDLDEEWPKYDPSELVGKGVSLDEGLNKKGKQSRIAKIRDAVRSFFARGKKPPTFEQLSGQGPSLDEMLASQEQEDNKAAVEGKDLGARPKVRSQKLSLSKTSSKGKKISSSSSKKPTKMPKKSSSPFSLGAKPKTGSKSRVSASLGGIKGKEISAPILQAGSALNATQLEDKLKSIWTIVEGQHRATYGWVGATVLTQALGTAANSILKSSGRRVTMPQISVQLQEKWRGIPLTEEDIRGICCAILDMTTNSSSFSEALEENEVRQDFLDLAVRAENVLTAPQMRVFASGIASMMREVTADVAKGLTRRNEVDVSLGAAAVRDSLQLLQELQKTNLSNWSVVLQVLVNDTFG